MSTTNSWSSTPDGTAVSKSFKPFSWANWLTKMYQDRKIEMVNPSSIVEAQTKVTRQWSTLNNVYNNTGINPAYYSVNKTGSKLYIEFRNFVRSVVSTADSDVEKLSYLPLRSAVVFDIPNDANITSDLVSDFVDQMLASIASATGDIAAELQKFRYGSLQP